jgi:hypothetical protein
MTSISRIARIVGTVAAVALAAPAFAPALAQDQTGENRDVTAAAPAGGGVEQMALAQTLYANGVARGDALTVLAAARLALAVQVEDAPAEAEQAPIAGAEPGETTGPDTAPPDAAAMLAMARELAGGDETILALIEDAEAEGARGRIGGAIRRLSRLPGGYSDVHRVPYYGGVLAELAIVGDGSSNLDVLVTDENRNTICYDVSRSDKVYCSWVPRWNGYFTVLVENRGRSRNSYYLMTN